jgi:hypothetical protein
MTEKFLDYSTAQLSQNIYFAPFSGIMDNPRGGAFHQGGPVWDDWAEAGRKRYLNRNRPDDQLPDVYEEPVKLFRKATAWLGPQFPHFGHFIADAATRFYATSRNSEIENYIIGDKAANVNGLLRSTTRDILDWFDIDTSRVWVACRPAIAETVFTFPQSEQRDLIGPSYEYLRDLHEHQNSKLSRVVDPGYKKVFVSRAGMPAHLAGERYLEKLFAEAGFTIIRPENLSLIEQLKIYAAADELVFTEGSALHALQLLGKISARVWVINRRPQSRLIEHLLAPRISNLSYEEACVNLIHGCRLSGVPAPETGLAIPTSSGIEACVARICGGRIEFHSVEYEAAVKADIAEWLKHESRQLRYQHPLYQPTLLETVKKTGLDKLVFSQ